MVQSDVADYSIGAAALAGQVEYNEHLQQAGEAVEVLPAPLAHFDDGVKIDESVEEWHFPSEEERRTLRRVPEKMNWATFSIAICEFAERFSFYGATQVYTNFINHRRPVLNDGSISRTGAAKDSGQNSGALGMGSEASNGLVTFNQFWCYVTPLFAAWLADTHWGRYKTIVWGVVVAEIGHILLVISAIPGVLDNEQGAKACFIIALIVMGTGTGVFKSSCPVFVSEQKKVVQQTVVTLKNGEQVIIDPALTTARVFVWYYLMINLGSLAGQLGMIYAERDIGFWLAYLLPTLVFLLPIPVLMFFNKTYVKLPPTGSILGTASKAIGRVLRAHWSWNPVRCIRNFKSQGVWDAARPSCVPEAERPVWMTYSDRWVDELRRGVKACGISIFLPLYWLCYNQITSNLITQAGQMDLGGQPTELVSQLDPIFVIVLVLLFNLVIYPLVDKYRIPFSPIKRITAGFIVASTSMIWAAVLQDYIYKTNPCGKHVGDSVPHLNAQGQPVMGANGQPELCDQVSSSLSVWIQSGPYVLIAFSEIFTSVVAMEVAMLMAPKNMRSMVMAVISTLTVAIASAIGEAFNPLSKNPLFTWSYTTFACLSFVGGIAFWFTFRYIDREQEQLNLIGQEGFDAEQGYEKTEEEKALDRAEKLNPNANKNIIRGLGESSRTGVETEKPEAGTAIGNDVA
ncbi:hypothetical protein MVES1_003223 [Malassezia vespertilionis]|uniref:Ptr2p n=1 Tax=Malassezia vespertilionis TaxID=2020962 RepID=A0A2N1J9K8_9BASI|nr:uncharacterized protein MVES1_003223 [Malassezia vespertilionis]PKI83233.1 hypothetical protein MVES_003063 [Malassezia vespertilionis]WFD07855.1 hypothetical protein MVES1_003223 [Malassezia vespertilionis]